MTMSARGPIPAWVDRMDYPFASRFVAVPAGRLHYIDEGTGESILFVHGTPTWCNASLRLIMPQAYGDRRKPTPAIHRQYLAPFPVPDDRERVPWALARALLGPRAYYADLWRSRERLRGRSVLVIWGLRDPALGPPVLARWMELFGPTALVLPARASRPLAPRGGAETCQEALAACLRAA
jgi:hypothetical protein